jgi:hypothetical protein
MSAAASALATLSICGYKLQFSDIFINLILLALTARGIVYFIEGLVWLIKRVWRYVYERKRNNRA